MHLLRRRAGLLLLVAGFAMPALAAEKFEPVNADDLAKSPQKYWATAIVFTDALKSPPGRDTMWINGEDLYVFKTKTVGDCYAPKRLVAMLKELKVGKDYSFIATVLQKGSKYVVTVQSLNITVSDVSELPTSLAAVVKASSNAVQNATFTRMEALLRGVQTDLLAYSKEHNVDVASLFDPLSKDRDAPPQMVNAGIRSMADQLKSNPNDLFVDFLVAILARENVGAGGLAAPATNSPAAAPIPSAAPAPEPEKKAAEEPAASPEPTPAPVAELAPAPEPVVEPAPAPAPKPAADVQAAPAPIEETPAQDEEINEPRREELEPPMDDIDTNATSSEPAQALPEDAIESFSPSGSLQGSGMSVIKEDGAAEESSDDVIEPDPQATPEPAPAAEPKPAPVVTPVAAAPAQPAPAAAQELDANAPVPMK